MQKSSPHFLTKQMELETEKDFKKWSKNSQCFPLLLSQNLAWSGAPVLAAVHSAELEK